MMWPSDKFLQRLLIASLVLHLVGAWFSQGFYHSDEHFQILEFLSWKLGLSSSSSLPIEVTERMRPWFETSVFYVITRFWQLLGVLSPFVWATSFRLLSTLIGWGATALLATCCAQWFSDNAGTSRISDRRLVVLLLCGIWYLPAFHARISSENWGGALFLIGLCVYLLKRAWNQNSSPRWGILAGVFWGLSFESRYQVGAMIAGAFAWLIFTQFKTKPRLAQDLGSLSLGLVLTIGACTAIDAWGYGRWSFAPWNYIDYNLVRGMVASVDTDPWWDLFRRAATETWPILGILLLVSFPLAWISEPLHVLTWTHVPLFLVHCVIGHKELRFLFPLIHAGPIFLAMAWFRIRPWIAGRGFKPILKLLIAWNIAGLLTLSLMPAWMPIRFLDYLWTLRSASPAPLVIYSQEKDPYEISGIALNFYRPAGVTVVKIPNYRDILSVPGPQLLFYDGFSLDERAPEIARSCVARFRALPDWIPNALKWVNAEKLLRHVTNWSLYECHATQ